MTEPLTWWATAPLLAHGGVPVDAALPLDHDALRAGTRLDEFEIVRVLGAGGFGIVYLALDHVLLRHVAVKEYMPTALAGRSTGAMVSVRSATLARTFAAGLESFFNEARMLASFDHPSLVKVYRFWKANGTAYMVMPYYPGQTLKEARLGMTAAPDEAWLRALVEPLLGALELLHGQGVYHRDIAPDNILLLPDGRPVLLDFGSARRVIGDRTQSLTAILKPNFAPVEQYADEAGMRQGPWTDLYALGATIHFMLTGHAPPPAVMRAVRDLMPPLRAQAGLSTAFLTAIDWTLAVAPDERPQDVASVRRALSGEMLPPWPTPRHGVAADAPLHAGDGSAIAATLPASAAVHASPAKASTRRSRRAAFAGLALAGLAVAAGSLWTWSPGAATPAVAAPAPSTLTPPIVAASDPPRLPQSVALALQSGSPPGSLDAQTAPTPQRPVQAARAAADKPAVPARAPRPPLEAQTPGARPEGAGRVGGPIDACGSLNFFSRALCVRRECAQERWSSHPQCADARRTEEQRQRRMEQ